jgi:hypothetical protein
MLLPVIAIVPLLFAPAKWEKNPDEIETNQEEDSVQRFNMVHPPVKVNPQRCDESGDEDYWPSLFPAHEKIVLHQS